MTAQQFTQSWTSIFPRTLPVSHLFKVDYHERWFRIHSLPGSKRYAETKEEWGILLNRQNTLITDLLGSNAKTLLVAGDYNFHEPLQLHITTQEKCFLNYQFSRLDDIPLSKVDADDYQMGDVYRPAFAEIRWQPGAHDTLLKSIADDEVRAFFVSFEPALLIAPYDGGVDVILPDAELQHTYKARYRDWLSALDSGL